MRKSLLTALVVGLLLGGWLGSPVAAQGPYSAQITRALNAFKAGAQTFTGAVTFSGPVNFTGALTTSVNGIGQTPTNGVVWQNTTAATVGLQQFSPRSCWIGQGWKSTATAASQSVTYCLDVEPFTGGTTAPLGGLTMTASINGGAFTTVGTWGGPTAGAGSYVSGTGLVSGTSVTAAALSSIGWSLSTILTAPVNGELVLGLRDLSAGTTLKTDALPTISSGTGTGIAVLAGSTPLSGAVNVGTVAPGTSIVINFNGNPFPSAPFPICQDDSTILAVRCSATTTQLTITSTLAFTASDIVSWVVMGSR